MGSRDAVGVGSVRRRCRPGVAPGCRRGRRAVVVAARRGPGPAVAGGGDGAGGGGADRPGGPGQPGRGPRPGPVGGRRGRVGRCGRGAGPPAVADGGREPRRARVVRRPATARSRSPCGSATPGPRRAPGASGDRRVSDPERPHGVPTLPPMAIDPSPGTDALAASEATIAAPVVGPTPSDGDRSSAPTEPPVAAATRAAPSARLGGHRGRAVVTAPAQAHQGPAGAAGRHPHRPVVDAEGLAAVRPVACG